MTAPVVNPRALYTLETARGILGLPKGTLPREVRAGRLRVSKRAGRYFLLGAWLLEWIEDGEVKRYRETHGMNGVAVNRNEG